MLLLLACNSILHVFPHRLLSVGGRPQVAMLGDWAPSLEELYAADNDVSDVADVVAAAAAAGADGSSTNGEHKVDGFRRLKSLDLSETKLTSWAQVKFVGDGHIFNWRWCWRFGWWVIVWWSPCFLVLSGAVSKAVTRHLSSLEPFSPFRSACKWLLSTLPTQPTWCILQEPRGLDSSTIEPILVRFFHKARARLVATGLVKTPTALNIPTRGSSCRCYWWRRGVCERGDHPPLLRRGTAGLSPAPQSVPLTPIFAPPLSSASMLLACVRWGGNDTGTDADTGTGWDTTATAGGVLLGPAGALHPPAQPQRAL